MRHSSTALQILLCLTFGLSLASCGKHKQSNEKRLTVSIEPLRYFTEQICGNDFAVSTLIPQGTSPETYEPTPRQLVDVTESRAFLQVGNLGIEQTWVKHLLENAPTMLLSTTAEGIERLRDTDHHEGDGTDPHVWTSPRNAQVMAANICRLLCQLDSSRAPYYQQRLKQFSSRIENVDTRIHQILSDAACRTFLIYHPALTYFARDYGLQQLSIEEGGKEPTPARLQQLIKRCRQDGVRVIFVQRGFSDRNATTIAHEIGARIVAINPLSYQWEKELLLIAQHIKNGK